MSGPDPKATAGNAESPAGFAGPESLLGGLFLVSGIAALAYQVCWQRILSSRFGSDIESITLTVSAFMLGLGLGALAGGQIADRHARHIVAVFAGFEFCIGLFGMASTALIPYVADLASLQSRAAGATAAFMLLLVPTAMMGATLPMLIAHFFRTERNVGVSTGQLYFVNTLGAALGASLTGLVAFHYLDLKQVIELAACANFAVASGALWVLRRQR
jgi:predicted membrane-bound spermidine synthase